MGPTFQIGIQCCLPQTVLVMGTFLPQITGVEEEKRKKEYSPSGCWSREHTVIYSPGLKRAFFYSERKKTQIRKRSVFLYFSPLHSPLTTCFLSFSSESLPGSNFPPLQLWWIRGGIFSKMVGSVPSVMKGTACTARLCKGVCRVRSLSDSLKSRNQSPTTQKLSILVKSDSCNWEYQWVTAEKDWSVHGTYPSKLREHQVHSPL